MDIFSAVWIWLLIQLFHWYISIVFHEYNPGMSKAVWNKTFLHLKGLIQAPYPISPITKLGDSEQFTIQKCGENIRCLYYKDGTNLSLNWTTLNMLHSAGQDVSSTEEVHFLVSNSQRELPSDSYCPLNICISQHNGKSWWQRPPLFYFSVSPSDNRTFCTYINLNKMTESNGCFLYM